VSGYEASTWYGLLVPAGTPNEVISRLNGDSLKVLRQQGVNERLDSAGLDAMGTTADEFGMNIRTEIAKWAGVVKASGARAD
jgi:tripartite-type tricarboxylate transporter receptor subunit TctC